ncbi:MAG: polyprenyl synthetase family protein [Alphaproteobacteria bacterium]|nr:polyprenyl synthetase family protein [Alphaproteobacteria bacterium]
MDRLTPALAKAAEAANRALADLMPKLEGPERRVVEAMTYATLNGGKRLRPFLVLCSASLFDVPRARALRVAAAAEYVHCYSLVHDDLPAMDDDDLRRGKPTTHIAFDEATAVLAGDGLLTLAFEVLGHEATHPDARVRADLVVALARAIGAEGMVGGQMFDLAAESMKLGLADITRLQAMKTGALFRFACEAGAILGQAPEDARAALRDYARDLGLAFQIADDLLDHEGTVEETGKAVGKDAAAGKGTFVSLLGAEEARRRARALADDAAAHVARFGAKAELLKDVARFVVERRA